MKYVVTGGAGFIGSHIVDALSSSHEVVVIDDFSSGREANLERSRERITVRKGSITDRSLLMEACDGADGIFHLAAIASVARSVDDPAATHRTNLTGTLHLLMAARECGVKKMVFSSSSAVYGDEPTLPKREEMPPAPLSPYAVSKLASEYYCTVFSGLFGIRTVSLRYFNVFGPRQDPNGEYAAVIPKFITRLLEHKPPLIYGDGGQTRDFVYVGDVVEANIRAMESGARGVFNIGSGQGTDLNTLAACIGEIMKIPIPPQYTAPRSGDIRDSVSDITAARMAFGFEPRHSLGQGLFATVRWFSGTEST